MDYQKQYDSLIERGRNRTLKGYSEKHHIIPKCMGGSNKKENLVRLTASKHFEAHFLLTKIYSENDGLIRAFILMSGKFDGKEIDAKEYEKLKKRYAKIVSKRFKDVPKGPMSEENKQSRRGPRGPMSEERKKNIGKANSILIFCTTNGIIYPSLTEAARQLGLYASNICRVLKGRYKHTCGYHFEYVNK